MEDMEASDAQVASLRTRLLDSVEQKKEVLGEVSSTTEIVRDGADGAGADETENKQVSYLACRACVRFLWFVFIEPCLIFLYVLSFFVTHAARCRMTNNLFHCRCRIKWSSPFVVLRPGVGLSTYVLVRNV